MSQIKLSIDSAGQAKQARQRPPAPKSKSIQTPPRCGMQGTSPPSEPDLSPYHSMIKFFPLAILVALIFKALHIRDVTLQSRSDCRARKNPIDFSCVHAFRNLSRQKNLRIELSFPGISRFSALHCSKVIPAHWHKTRRLASRIMPLFAVD